MLLLLLDYVLLRALWKIDVHLISTLINKSLYYYYFLLILLYCLTMLQRSRLAVFASSFPSSSSVCL